MFEAGRDFEVDNLEIYENSLFALGKAINKHKTQKRLCFVLIDDGEIIFDKRGITFGKERFQLKEQFNALLMSKHINIKESWRLPVVKTQLGVSQRRYGNTLGKKEIDVDIAEQDFTNLIKIMRLFSEKQSKTILICAHFDEYYKDTSSLDAPHCHIVYNRFTKFEKNSLGDFLISR